MLFGGVQGGGRARGDRVGRIFWVVLIVLILSEVVVGFVVMGFMDSTGPG